MYNIIDRQTGKTVRTANSLKTASAIVNRLDLEYGAVRYTYKRVHTVEEVLTWFNEGKLTESEYRNMMTTAR